MEADATKEIPSYCSICLLISDYRTIEKDATSVAMFERVLSAINAQVHQVLNPSLLKELYLFFIYLSDLSQNGVRSRSSDKEGIKIDKLKYIVKFVDIFNICSFFFNELSGRFKLLFLDGASQSWGSQEDLILLLRCCIAILPLLEVEPSLFLDKCRDLLMILRKLSAPDLSLEHSDLSVSFVCSVLEVFVDELLANRHLRQYFLIVDDFSFTNERLFKHHLVDGSGHIEVVLEVLCAHLILSVHNEHKKPPCSELSLAAALQLLGSPVLVSAPHMLQAHLTSMVSRCVGVDRSSDDPRVSAMLKKYYASAFERSSILYTRQMSCLKLGDCHLSANSGCTSCDKAFITRRVYCPSFDSYVRAITCHDINQVITVTDHSPSFSFKTKSEFLRASGAYFLENEQILNKFFKDQILSVLNTAISQILLAKVEGLDLYTNRDLTPQETYCFASVILLMGNSLLQIIQCMDCGTLSCQKNLKGHSFMGEYDFVIQAICGLLKYTDGSLTEKHFEELTGSKLTTHKESKLMVMHFLNFLPLCYDREDGHLWKACMYMMMALMNLIIFEDGNLEVFKEMVGLRKEPPSSNSATTLTKASGVHSPSLKVASKFEKIQKGLLRERSADDGGTCDGRSYLKLRNVSDSEADDIADYIECNSEKDYSKWLNDRAHYWDLKVKKIKSLKQEKTKKKEIKQKSKRLTSLKQNGKRRK